MTNQEEMALIRAGFVPDQISEIREGSDAGLDTSVYAKKEFLAIQMRQIRLGMMEKLHVQIYAIPEFDWFQMEEIRKGMQQGVDIKRYANPGISYAKMRQIRIGLQAGVDLSSCLKLDAGVIRELRKAQLSQVNIAEYINEGYEPEQLEQIRLALEKGIDASAYLCRELRGASIREICQGLESGVDVSCYAGMECGWRQMREIRLGLEHRVDVKLYQSPLYSWSQMHEIRLGLESGLDVSSFRSLMYTAKEMHLKRIALMEGNKRKKAVEPVDQPPLGALQISDKSETAKLHISADEMQVQLEICGGQDGIGREDILNMLKTAGITQGIREEGIKEATEGKAGKRFVLAAEGAVPKNGADGWYEFFFRTDFKKEPKLLPDGSVDYQNSEWFVMVEEGQKLATYHEAEEGTDGYTVTGKVLPARKGREKSVLTGRGFKLSEDKRTYISAVSGKIELHDSRMEISKMLVVPEVTLATGNVNFNGSVYVKGNVGGGTVIKAEEDVIVDGFVESATIECGGGILLRQGANASGNGLLKAGKGIKGKFFETIELRCEESIQANYCMNCDMYTKKKIIVSGRKGALVGGSAYAAEGIDCYYIGNRMGCETHIRMGVNEQFLKKQQEIVERISEAAKELQILKNAQTDIEKKYPPKVYHTMDIYRKIEDAVFTKTEEIKHLGGYRNLLEKADLKLKEVKAIVRGRIYEGVVVEISGVRWFAKEARNVTVRRNGARIAVYAN